MAKWVQKYSELVATNPAMLGFEATELGKWAFKKHDTSYSPCLCFTANTAGSTVNLMQYGTPTLGQNFQFSTDGINWGTFTNKITLAKAGDFVYFKGDNPNGVSESESVFYNFQLTGSISASGNVMSLIDNGACECVTIPNAYCFYSLFTATYQDEHTALTSAPSLPATTLKNYCYKKMFSTCQALTTVPVLVASGILIGCYERMFSSCTSLIVSDASGTGYSHVWRIPFGGGYEQKNMFEYCAEGSGRSSDHLSSSKTFYTQNTPVV